MIAANATQKVSLLPDVEKRWTKPELRFVKLNVDAAYHTDEGAGTATAILRDIRGNFIAASCIYYPIAANVVTSEAMAMRDGLAFANTMGFMLLKRNQILWR